MMIINTSANQCKLLQGETAPLMHNLHMQQKHLKSHDWAKPLQERVDYN
jgi:hypothetical protein